MNINEEVNLSDINIEASISSGMNVSNVGIGGPRGEKGDKGDKGEKGEKGDTGNTGPQGPQGERGSKGDTGAKGDKGDTGEQGPQGEKGAKGDTGPANTLSIGTVESGSSASATITGTSPNQTLNLTLPKGDKGDKGDTGETGATGPKGDTGSQGAKGDTSTIAIGTVTTLSPGSNATVTNTGTSTDAIFNFGIPKGAPSITTTSWGAYHEL